VSDHHRPLPGKTTTSAELVVFVAQHSSRVLAIDLDSPPPQSEPVWTEYAPLIMDVPPSLGVPCPSPEWEEALRVLGLDGDDGFR
jgi:hypothetical protein